MGRVEERARTRAIVLLALTALLTGAVEGLAPGAYPPFHLGVLLATGMSLGLVAVPVAAGVAAVGVLLVAGPAAGPLAGLGLDALVAVLGTLGMDAVAGRHGRIRSVAVLFDMVVVTGVVAGLRVAAGTLVGDPATAEEFAFALLALHIVMPGLRVVVLGERLIPDRGSVVGVLPELVLMVALGLLVATGGPRSLLAILAMLLLAFLVSLRWGFPFIAAGASLLALVMHALRLVVDLEPVVPSEGEAFVIDLAFLAALAVAAEMDRFRDMLAERDVSFEQAANGLLVVGVAPPWRVVRGNGAARELLGAPVVGVPAAQLLGEGVQELLVRACDEQRSARTRLELAPDGARPRWVELAATRITTTGPAGDRFFVELVDVTELTHATDAMQRANEELHGVARTIAHDLAQPLAAVAGFAAMIRTRDGELDPALRERLLTRLEASAVGVRDRVQDIVAAAATAGGAPAPVSLPPLLDSLEASLAVTDDWALERDLAAESIVTERVMLTGVLGNLVDNAVKHGRTSGAPPQVAVSSQRLRGGTVVRVTDDGPGIPVAHLGDVLEPGVQLASVDGQGAGLASAAHQAELAGCELTALPDPDGARLELWVPDGSGTRPLQVLVAQQHPERRRLLRGLLDADARVRDVGAVATHSDLTGAVEAAGPDVLLLDPGLGEGAAVHDLARVAAVAPGVTTILVATGAEIDGMADLAAELGVHVAMDAAELDAELVRLVEAAG